MVPSAGLMERTIHQIRIGTENAAVRAGDPNNYQEVCRLQGLLNSDEYLRHFPPPKEIPTRASMGFEHIDAMPMLNQDPTVRFNELLRGRAVSPARFIVSRSVRYADNSHGLLLGMVSIGIDRNFGEIHYDLDSDRIEKELQLVESSPYPRLEIAYAKHPDAESRQIGSAVRQVLYKVYEATTNVTEVIRLSDGTYQVNRFDHLGAALPSSTVIKQSLGAGESEGIIVITPVVVIAYIDPTNIASRRVAESAGFVHLYEMIYQLDWNLWQEKLRRGGFELR